MKRGKKICNTLKEVRMQVAKANDIKYAPTECRHEGDCAGTCPKCESEVRWLEQQLQLRRQLGKAVAMVGVSVGLAALTACNSNVSNKTASEMDVIPDTLTEVNTAAEPCATDSSTVPDTVSIESQITGFIDLPDTLSLDDAEHHPSFPGGRQALLDFMDQNVNYPEQAKKDGVEGRVEVGFVVDTDGNITDPEVIRSVHPLLDAEALRVVKLMPKWKPGTENGTPVKVKCNVPVTFEMD